MPSTRRAFLAAAMAAAAGCVDTTEPGTGTATGDTTATPTAGTDTPDPGTDPPADAPPFVRWARETPHDALGTLSLSPGGDGPAVYVGSAAADRAGATPDDGAEHTLHALSLRDGTEQWQVSLPNPVQTAPLYGGHDGLPRIYVSTGRRSVHGRGWELHALDPSRGERVWGFDTRERRFLYPLAAADDGVVVGRRDDQLGEGGEHAYALEAADGSERWRVESGDVGPGDVALGGNAVHRGTVFLRTARRLRALDPATGEEHWRVEADEQLDGPVYDNRGERVTVGHDGTVRALALDDGRELWRREFDFTVSRLATLRQAMDETVFVGDYDGRLLALSPLDGGTRWTLDVGDDQFYPSVRRTSESLFVDGAGVHALEPVSGERKWSYTPDVEGHVDVHASTGVFASVGRENLVAALDPETGEERWRFDPGGDIVGPATAGEFAWVGVDRTVYALDGSGDS